MRFDDSLRTVLASDTGNGFGAQATWRQLVDLVGRGRAADDPATMDRLRSLRPTVAVPARAASARALAFATPPAPLVALFAEDELAIAAPVLRTATLSGADWLTLLPRLSPPGRSVLRHRRDLPPEVVRGLESFGSVDFVLDHESAPQPPAAANEPVTPAPDAATPLADTPFQPVAEVARHIPVVAEALRRAGSPSEAAQAPPPGGFAIADLKARIDAFRERPAEFRPSEVRPSEVRRSPFDQPDSFRFETDAAGTIRWIDGPARPALVGVSLAHGVPQGLVQVGEAAAGAFRARARFADVRLVVDGASAAAGTWRLAGHPAFDPASGRFTGFRGVARRLVADESAPASGSSDSLRQLVHELRTPTNAIAGFAELIETQLLGPVAPPYRERAEAIRHKTASLLAAIEDLDTAARIEGHALDLRAGEVALEPLIVRVLADLAPLARLRGAGIGFDPVGEHVLHVDDRAVERLIGRLLTALLAVAAPGERLMLTVAARAGGRVAVQVQRPAALAMLSDEGLFGVDAGAVAEGEGMPLLGTGFALRLARDLAAELGGSLAIEPARLTLRLPTALVREVEQAAQ